MYELLTDQQVHPIRSQTPGEIEEAICERQPKKPSAVVKQLDKDLDKIVLKALRKEPGRRYASASSFRGIWAAFCAICQSGPEERARYTLCGSS